VDNKQIINMICAYKCISQAQAARLTGRLAQSFNYSIKHNNISLDDFIKLCDALSLRLDVVDKTSGIKLMTLQATNDGKDDN